MVDRKTGGLLDALLKWRGAIQSDAGAFLSEERCERLIEESKAILDSVIRDMAWGDITALTSSSPIAKRMGALTIEAPPKIYPFAAIEMHPGAVMKFGWKGMRKDQEDSLAKVILLHEFGHAALGQISLASGVEGDWREDPFLYAAAHLHGAEKAEAQALSPASRSLIATPKGFRWAEEQEIERSRRQGRPLGNSVGALFKEMFADAFCMRLAFASGDPALGGALEKQRKRMQEQGLKGGDSEYFLNDSTRLLAAIVASKQPIEKGVLLLDFAKPCLSEATGEVAKKLRESPPIGVKPNHSDLLRFESALQIQGPSLSRFSSPGRLREYRRVRSVEERNIQAHSASKSPLSNP